MFRNFLFDICELAGDWNMKSFVEQKIAEIKARVGDKKVLCALSGGVDSSVAAVLVHKAVGKQLTCIFVDHGLLRKDEGDQVEQVFKDTFDMNFIRVNAKERFLGKLAGVSEPERKRKSSAPNSSTSSMKNRANWARSISSSRGPFIRTLWKAAAREPARPSRATTMWAVCRRTWTCS